VVKAVRLPGQTYVFVAEGNLKFLGERVAEAGTVVFEREVES
jgi:hypothetical protein